MSDTHPIAPPVADEFALFRSGRFELRRVLGSGGFGVVCEAFDRERGTCVAVKILRHAAAATLYRFKREFRTVADFVHPNLVALYDLIGVGEQWFFTMELIDGLTFFEYVVQSAHPPRSDTGRVLRAGVRRSCAEEASALPPIASDLGRLRSALRQLASGIAAIHAAGHLHRDLKPGNVIVDRQGRVVILDFGIAVELAPSGADATLEASVAGTPAFMAPEQASGRPLDAAADWYAFGVMLFQALVGRVPFKGAEVFSSKERIDPPAPSSLVHGVPPDLDQLCRGLLRRDPRERPSGPEILRILGAGVVERAGESSESGTLSLPSAVTLVGRDAELGALRDAFERACAGIPVAVFLRGPAGSGKSALVRTFLDGLDARKEAVCLQGRCHERERVPFKTIDSLVDAFTRYLRRLTPSEIDGLLPDDVAALGRLFPVLRRVDAIGQAPAGAAEVDPREARRRGAEALKYLLARCAESRPFVLAIDDVQWGDLDGALILSEFLRPPDAPPALLILSYRSDEAAGAAVDTLLAAAPPDPEGGAELRELALEPLSKEAARDLALAWARAENLGVDAAVAEEVARESGGNPFRVGRLLRWLADKAADGGELPGIALEDAIRASIAALASEERGLLEVVAVAGRPLEQAVAARAAKVAGSAERAALSRLRGGGFVRTRRRRDRDVVEVYDNSVRETIVAGLPPKVVRERHRAVAEALAETAADADPEALALHFRMAGDAALAARWAVTAADRSAGALAFDQSARLYREALEGGDHEVAARRALLVKLGNALVNGGRGAEAARAYLEAAETTPEPAPALELRRRAAEQLLRSGHFDEAEPVIRDVLGAVGLRPVGGGLAGFIDLVVNRILVRLRGLSFVERPATSVPAAELARLDVCYSVASGLSMVDTIRGATFGARSLRLALRAGEPLRVLRAYGIEAGYSSAGGCPNARRTERLVEAGRAVAARVGGSYAPAYIDLGAGLAAYMEGRFLRSFELCESALRGFRAGCTGVAWEQATAEIIALWSLFYLGRLRELSERVGAAIRDADGRGDLYAATNFRVGLAPVAWLVADNADEAIRVADEGLARWTRRAINNLHGVHAYERTQVFLYLGRGAQAWAWVNEVWERVRSGYVLDIHHFRVVWHWLRGRAALAAAETTGASEARALRRRALADARTVAGLGAPFGLPMAHLLRAGVAAGEGDRAAAAVSLEAARAGFWEANMPVHAAAAARRLATWSPGGANTARAAAVTAFLREQGVVDPARLTAMIAPGLG